jgi:serine/threonine protein kinase
MVEAIAVQGEFRLLHKIGEGGMADVFLAERLGDDGFKTRVALKRLHRGLAMDSYFIRQLIREARLLGQLEHANIVKVFDLRRIGDEYYIVMEYVDGIDLAAVVKVHRTRKTRIPRPFFFHVALSLSEALSYAHAAVNEKGDPTPLIHRDIKPSNVMLSRRGAVKLTDFGIAHVGDGSVTGGLVQGTANYMSPEQAFGEDRLTPASDVYSLGSVFYEMLTGRPNVDGDNYLKAIHQVRERRVTLDELAGLGVEPGLRMVIAKMLSADINGRYRDMDSVRNDLQFVAERLKIDLSWHRIRAYVGRLMGILGRTADRATLTNLQVPEEIQRVARHVIGAVPDPPPLPGTGAADGPPTPATPPPMARLKRDEATPVTRAVRKDLIDNLLGETVAVPMRPGLPGDDPLAGPLASRPPVPAPPPPGPTPAASQGVPIMGPEGWVDEESTRVYEGRSPAEQGVMGAGQMGALKGPPSPATLPLPFGSGALQPAAALVDLGEPTVPPTRAPTGIPSTAAVTAPPGLVAAAINPAGAAPGSGLEIPVVPARPAAPAAAPPPTPRGAPEETEETDTEVWVFADSMDDDLAASSPSPAARSSGDGQARRRRRKRRKSKPVSPLLLTALVLMILFLLCAVLVAIAFKQGFIGQAATEAVPVLASFFLEIFPCPGADHV